MMSKEEVIEYTLRIARDEKDAYEALVERLRVEMEERLAGERKSWEFEIYQARLEGASIPRITRTLGVTRPQVLSILGQYGMGAQE